MCRPELLQQFNVFGWLFILWTSFLINITTGDQSTGFYNRIFIMLWRPQLIMLKMACKWFLNHRSLQCPQILLLKTCSQQYFVNRVFSVIISFTTVLIPLRSTVRSWGEPSNPSNLALTIFPMLHQARLPHCASCPLLRHTSDNLGTDRFDTALDSASVYGCGYDSRILKFGSTLPDWTNHMVIPTHDIIDKIAQVLNRGPPKWYLSSSHIGGRDMMMMKKMKSIIRSLVYAITHPSGSWTPPIHSTELYCIPKLKRIMIVGVWTN